MFDVCACTRFQVTPKVSHLYIVKRIFRYLKGKPKLGLQYPKDSLFDLEAYTDSDYAGAILDRKSTIEGSRNPTKPQQTFITASLSNLEPSSGPIPFVVDETVINEWEDKMERDATTASSLEAGHWCQDTILGGAKAQIRFEAASKQSNDPPLSRVNTLRSGEDNMKLKELMEFYAKLSDRDRVKKLEKKRRSRTYKPRRLYKVGLSRRIESTDDASLGAQEDASKQGRKIVDLDADIEVTLIDETQGRNDEDLMFDAGVLNSDEVFQEPIVNTDTTTKSSIPVSVVDPVTTTGEVVTTASVEIPEELTLAQTLIEIKSAKPKAVTTTTVKLASSRPKAKGIVFHDQEEQASASTPIVSPLQLPQAKDKGKAKMVEPEKPLKKKDQIAIDEDVARNLEAQLQAELEEEDRLSRQKEEEANIALIKSWDNTQAMMDADFQLAQQMQTEEQEQLSIEEKSKLFVELLEKRNKNFAALRAQEKRNKPPNKAQKINIMSIYLKNIVGYKHNPLKSKSYDEIQEIAREELESDNSKKQRIDEHVEAKRDDDQEEAEVNKHMEIVQDDEMLQNIDREDLETLWKLVKAKHGNTRPEEAYERVLWGDLKVMFELDIESEVWRSLEGHNVTVWKLFSSSGVHFVRFKNLHIFMLVEKKYPLTPATITGMLNKKLQVDQWNEIKFQLLNAFG
ncbi:hypothetical protein Tco_0548536 [Tanacetum coccineum]